MKNTDDNLESTANYMNIEDIEIVSLVNSYNDVVNSYNSIRKDHQNLKNYTKLFDYYCKIMSNINILFLDEKK